MGLFKPKKASQDFKEENLPSNRKEVFFDLFKVRFTTFLKIGLLLLLFAFPLIIISFIKDSVLFSIQAQVESGAISLDEVLPLYNTTNMIYYLAQILGFIIFGLGLSGALRVIRQMVWGEPVFFQQDFFEGIRLNGKHYSIYFLFMGLFNFSSRLTTSISGIPELLKYIPLGMCYAIFLPALVYALVLTQIYTNSVITEYKKSFILYIKTLPTTILAIIVLLLPLLFNFINAFIIKHFIIIIFIILFFPFILTGEFLYYMSKLDKYINKEQYPEIYDKGIYRKENV